MPKDQRQRIVVIARNGLELGRLAESEVAGLLATGFLRATDAYRWDDGSTASRPLHGWEAGEDREQPSPPWLDTAARSLSTATGAFANHAGKVTGRVASFVSGGKAALDEGVIRVLEDYLPEIRKSVAAQAVATPALAIRSAIGNDELMRKLFGAVHDCLPRPIHRFVPESVFVEFCLLNRRRLFDSEPARTNESPSHSPPED